MVEVVGLGMVAIDTGGEGVMCDGGTTGHCCPPSILNSPLGQAV